MRIVKLTAEHILAVQLQPAQAYAAGLVNAAHANDLASATGVAWAAESDGQVIACAGILELHPDRAIAWAMLSADALHQFKIIHRIAGQVLRSAPWRRIEMAVDCNHARACAWAERLGFQMEGRMRAYTPDGRDCFLYAKVK